MLDVVDGLEDGEQGVVVALQLGPLVGVDGVLDGQRVQPELLGDTGEFGLGRLVQPDPDEAAVARAPGASPRAGSAARRRRGGRRGRRAQSTTALSGVDGVAGGVVRGTVVACAASAGRTDGGTQVADHRHGRLLHGPATSAASAGGTCPEWGRTEAYRLSRPQSGRAPLRRGGELRLQFAENTEQRVEGALPSSTSEAQRCFRMVSTAERRGSGSSGSGDRCVEADDGRTSRYCTVDSDPSQPHLLRPVPVGDDVIP